MATQLTLVDAGVQGFRPLLDEHLRSRGRAIYDIAAVILTHGHPAITSGWRRACASTRPRPSTSTRPTRIWPAPARSTSSRERCSPTCATRRCGSCSRWAPAPARFRTPKIAAVTTFIDGDLDVPGRPRIIPTPGHSPGHVVFHLPGPRRGVRRRRALQLQPADRRPRPAADAEGVRRRTSPQALSTLDTIAAVDAGTLLFGHGEPWTDGPASAVAHAREVGVT